MKIQTDHSSATYRRRAIRLIIVAFVTCLILVGRLAYLQLVRGDVMERASQSNFIRTRALTAKRGNIVDRNGERLAFHRARFDLEVTPSQVGDVDRLLSELRPILRLQERDWLQIKDKITGARGMHRHRPIRIARDINRQQVVRVESLRAQSDGISVKTIYQRSYPFKAQGAHLLGYLGKMTRRELKEDQLGRPAQAMIGRFGLERVFDLPLSGRDGLERFVVNAQGARLDTSWSRRAMSNLDERRPPTAGAEVHLTIDSRVQTILVKALRRHQSGSAIVMNPWSGEVLGLVSKPSFDPNQWSGRLTKKVKDEIDANPYHPMLDKSVQAYFPGSVYKIVSAFAALEQGLLTKSSAVESPGAYEFGGRVFHCHKRSGHGRIDLSHALAASADVYFYKIGETLGIDLLAEYGRRFGFGAKTGLGLNGESGGNVPTKAYHDEKTKGGFQHGLALSTAVGQGDVKASILQVARAYAAVANGGRLVWPRVTQKVVHADGAIEFPLSPLEAPEIGGDPAHLTAIHEGLVRAVGDLKIGTAFRAAVPGISVAGKTGTAQIRELRRGFHRQAVAHFRDRDHAWFAGYAPAEDPQLVVVVLLDHGGSGGKQAAPVAGEILREYHRKIESLAPRPAPEPVGDLTETR